MTNINLPPTLNAHADYPLSENSNLDEAKCDIILYWGDVEIMKFENMDAYMFIESPYAEEHLNEYVASLLRRIFLFALVNSPDE